MPILDARDLDKTYADVAVLDGVSLTLRRGESVGLVGNIVYYNTVLGRIDLQTGKITGGDIV